MTKMSFVFKYQFKLGLKYTKMPPYQLRGRSQDIDFMGTQAQVNSCAA